MSTDSVSDLFTRIRNAQRAGHKSVKVLSSKMSKSILDVLKTEGYIDTYKLSKDADSSIECCTVFLRYDSEGEPLISEVKRVSRPGWRIYRGVSDIPKPRSGLGITLVSTSSGIMTDREARRKRVGGEVLATLY